MNQILSTSLNNKKSNKKKWYKIQFIVSITVIVCLISFGFFYYQDLIKKEQLSNQLMSNYNIYKLYSNQNQSKNTTTVKENINGIFGIIEIPKLNLHYPIFSELSDELLKIAPCKFYGKTPDKFSNLCIAGHNYHNTTFFSRLSNLENNDEIYIYDNNENQYKYYVYNIYEVEASDLSPVFVYSGHEKILTLFTCDISGTNRIIIKAKQII